jgi:hypothetical protein
VRIDSHCALEIAASIRTIALSSACDGANPSLGPNHSHTLASLYLVVPIFHALGLSEIALSIVSAVADAQEANRTLGPEHPDTLTSRSLIAQLFLALGRNKEALPIAEAVANSQKSNPTLGPDHPHTLATRALVTRILQTPDTVDLSV